MIAFEVYLNDQFLCRAGINGRHTLVSSLHLYPQNFKSTLLVMGIEMNEISPPQHEDGKLMSREQFTAFAQQIAKFGMQNWVSQELKQDFKIDIKIVDVDPTSITETEILSIDEKHFGKALKSFEKIFPKK